MNVARFCGLRGKRSSEIVIQIVTLIVSVFAFAYLMAMLDDSLLEIVKAEETSSLDNVKKCCMNKTSGEYCQDIFYAEFDKKCGGQSFSSCGNTEECKKGCCYNKRLGTCSGNVPKSLCREDIGIWKDNCESIKECKKGCCVLGSNTQFITERECERLADIKGYLKEWNAGVKTEIECLAMSYSRETGACVYDIGKEETCLFTTKQNCMKITKNKIKAFHAGVLCTNKELGQICHPTRQTKCVEGKHEVYFMDSCGNAANIYEASKIDDESYWSFVVTKDKACDDKKGNVESKKCGNCDYFSGSICGISKRGTKAEYGDYICRDVNCIDEKGNKRKNGESWCYYEGSIGPGKNEDEGGRDLVGSRHVRRYCINGVVESEPCEEFRNTICVQADIELADGSKFSNSACRMNRWQECISYNQETDKKKGLEKCAENSDCYVKRIGIDDGFDFEVCAPRYAPGFDLSIDSNGQKALQTCSMGNQMCVMVFEKKISGSWKCVYNCHCRDKAFTEQTNEYCTSLGDCGYKMNVVGDVDEEAYSVSRAPRLSKSDAVGDLTWDKEVAKPGNLSEFFAGVFGKGGDHDASDVGGKIAGWMAGSVVGGAGGLLVAASAVISSTVVAGAVSTGSGFFSTAASILAADASLLAADATISSAAVASWAAAANAAGAAAIMVAVTFIMIKIYGLGGDAAIATMIFGAVAAVGAGLISVLVTSSLVACLTTLYLCPAIALAIIIFATVMKLLGIGKTKKKYVEFKCMPWNAPTGGQGKCEECMKDKIALCSKYKCESLGQSCKYLNEGTGKEVCVYQSDSDISSPTITPNYGLITEGYAYKEVSNAGFKVLKKDGSCVDDFTTVIFGISTNNKPSRCRMDFNITANYNEMEYSFGDNNLFAYNHTFPLFLPSREAAANSMFEGFDEANFTEEELKEIDELKEKALTMLGDLTIYVRCIDSEERGSDKPAFVIRTCVKEGPDETAPAIVKTSPEDNSYVAYGRNETLMELYVNEPADCRWSSLDQNYETMENKMYCENMLEEATVFGWKCNTTLTGIKDGTNTFNFKCKDKPWMKEEQDKNGNRRVTNSESKTIRIIRSLNVLEIKKAEPTWKIVAGKQPVSVNVSVETAGGVENGKAACYYSLGGLLTDKLFFKTYSTKHEQIFDALFEGVYNINISCEDIAGNIAKKEISFEIDVDDLAPSIARVFFDPKKDKLVIVTDEEGECRYSDDILKACNFDFKDGKEMSDYGKRYETDWKKGTTYYIKCRDIWNNDQSDCLKIRMYESKEKKK